MSEMKQSILEVAERILKDHVDKDKVDILEEGQWAEDLWALLAENGLTLLGMSEEQGGFGGDIEDLLNVVRLMGQYAAPIPFAETTLTNTLLDYVGLNCTEDIATFMIATDQAFRLDGNQVSGTAYHVPWARFAQQLAAIVEGEQGQHIAVIDLTHATIVNGKNLASEPRDIVTLENAQVAQLSKPLSEQELLYIQKLQVAFQLAAVTGATSKINDLTVQYTKERSQFGRPIHRFQLVQQHIVHLAGELAIIQAAFYNVVEALLNGTEENEIAYSRLRIEDAVSATTAISHQVHAAIGTTFEYALQQYTRRLWAWRDEGKSSNDWAEKIAEDLLNDDSEDLWSYLTKSRTIGVQEVR